MTVLPEQSRSGAGGRDSPERKGDPKPHGETWRPEPIKERPGSVFFGHRWSLGDASPRVHLAGCLISRRDDQLGPQPGI